jgi:hypothetical protein
MEEISLRTLTRMLEVNRVTVHKWLRGDSRPPTSLERILDIPHEVLPKIPNSLLALGFAQVASGIVELPPEVLAWLEGAGQIQRLREKFPQLIVKERTDAADAKVPGGDHV